MRMPKMNARSMGIAVAALCAVSAAAGYAFINLSSSAVAANAPPPQMRRITESQYRNTIADVFSPDIRVVGRFEPDLRVEGLAAVGSSQVSISSSGYEHYHALAGRIADQLLEEGMWSAICPAVRQALRISMKPVRGKSSRRLGSDCSRRQMDEGSVDEWLEGARYALEHVGISEPQWR